MRGETVRLDFAAIDDPPRRRTGGRAPDEPGGPRHASAGHMNDPDEELLIQARGDVVHRRDGPGVELRRHDSGGPHPGVTDGDADRRTGRQLDPEPVTAPHA